MKARLECTGQRLTISQFQIVPVTVWQLALLQLTHALRTTGAYVRKKTLWAFEVTKWDLRRALQESPANGVQSHMRNHTVQKHENIFSATSLSILEVCQQERRGRFLLLGLTHTTKFARVSLF